MRPLGHVLTVVPATPVVAVPARAGSTDGGAGDRGSDPWLVSGGGPDWVRLAPGYVAYALDFADDGEVVFVGNEVPVVCEDVAAIPDLTTWDACMLAVIADQRCEAVGCSLDRFSDGRATRVATEQIDENFDQAEIAYGLSDIAVSDDGRRIAATALGGQADAGRVWLLTESGTLYAVTATADGLVMTGFSGTCRMNRHGTVRRIGEPGEAVWASPSGRTVFVAASRAPNTVVVRRTHDGGRTWTSLPFVDPQAGDGEQFIVTDLVRDGAGTLWAVGGSRYEPAAYLWRESGSSLVRTPGPADDSTGPNTDATPMPDGRIVVASRLGMFAHAT